MKAVVQDRYGSPDVLQLREVEKPIPADDQVLIRVRGASVNALDWHYLRGSPFVLRLMAGLVRPKNPVRGEDVAGTIETVGKNVKRWKPGAEVFGTARGSFGEYATTAEGNVAPKPRNLTFEQAAALPIAAFTALEALRDHAHVKAGQRVVVYGAGGGVGSFAVQIAKSFGAHVTAVTSTRNVEAIRSLGADAVIDYTKEDFTSRGERYDVLVDVSGNRSFTSYRRVLNPDGALVAVGGKGFGRVFRAKLASRLGKPRVATFMAKGRDEDLDVLKELAESGKVTPLIDRKFSLSQVPDAIRYMETHRVCGKLVISLA